ncbi:TrmH family RNA methyltransferase [Salinispira pacifica]|uniref:Putative rRNA methylase n=1 Tax=Salinispira pacifica TaxID=1307761 RepID=V5WF52_9SPIO|nr:RNA methyltransferase [Salinispira pacifica]AHC14265.1 putative rRNA methylase [Salinispira pacifica]
MNSGEGHSYYISSSKNPKIKDDIRLRERRHRRLTGLMTVEGYPEFRLAWESGAEIRRLYICPDFIKDNEQAFLSQLESRGLRPLTVSSRVMDKLAYREHPDAWLAVLEWKRPALNDPRMSGEHSSGLYIIAEDLEKPGNLGAILRSADASAAAGVIVSEGRTDLSNPNVVRASKGVNFTMPCTEAGNSETWEWLSSRNIPVLIADPGGESLWETSLPVPAAVVLGAEKEGVSSFWRERASLRIGIPMDGRVNSLNVAQAGTLIMYEYLRRKNLEIQR